MGCEYNFLFPSLTQSLFLCLFPAVRTLYSCTMPFCSSSGGGCQDTRIAVPLSPLPVKVTPRGAALGAAIRDGETCHIHTLQYEHCTFILQCVCKCACNMQMMYRQYS